MGNNAKLLIATLAGTLLLIIGVSVFFSGSGEGQQRQPVDQAVLLDGATHFKGATAEAAKVTIVEFSDLQCPACANTSPVLQSMVESYPQVRLVYRHFPLMSIHRNAVAAGQAAEAAHEQGKFWEMHDVLFKTQVEWETLSDPSEYFLGLANRISLDQAAFQTAYESPATRELVMKDLRLAEQLKLGSTPSLFYNGEPLDVTELAIRLAAEFPDTTQQLFDSAASESATPEGGSAAGTSEEGTNAPVDTDLNQ
jgi:protein-disulfide isomerase